jgi:hypothetical protein
MSLSVSPGRSRGMGAWPTLRSGGFDRTEGGLRVPREVAPADEAGGSLEGQGDPVLPLHGGPRKIFLVLLGETVSVGGGTNGGVAWLDVGQDVA